MKKNTILLLAILLMPAICNANIVHYWDLFEDETMIWHEQSGEGLLEIGCYVPNEKYSNSHNTLKVEIQFRGEFMSNLFMASYSSLSGCSTQLVKQEITGDDWKTLIAEWHFEPNPEYEILTYTFCGIGSIGPEVSYTIVDTMSVPEPTMICLLGLGSLIFLLKQRKE